LSDWRKAWINLGGKRANRHPQPSTLVSRDIRLSFAGNGILRLTHKQFASSSFPARFT
jgi:hypothetical protein